MRLIAHAGGQAARGAGLLEAGGVDDFEDERADPCFTQAPVAGETGHRIDQRGAARGQAIEQRRLAHVGPADDHRSGRHRSAEREQVGVFGQDV